MSTDRLSPSPAPTPTVSSLAGATLLFITSIVALTLLMLLLGSL